MEAASQRWFWISCLFESSLFVLAAVIAFLTGLPLFADFHWDLDDVLWGMSATAPPLAFFVASIQSKWKPLAEIRSALDRTLGRCFSGFTILHLLVISILAGIAEEVLFRAAVQGGLAKLFGPIPGLILASIGFGCAHFLNWGYAALTFLAGLYLGGVWLATGNLLTPIVTHALYDFVALVYYLRIASRETSGGSA